MQYTSQELQAIQEAERSMLRRIVAVCEQEGIEYFVIGGTTLGVVRHGGFIPWDDDIDIGMTREHYERFLALAPDKLGDGVFLQTVDSDPQSPFPYAKVRLDGTVFLEYAHRRLAMHPGVFVDIFPYDNIPDGDEARRAQFDRVRRIVRWWSLRTTPDVSAPPQNTAQQVRSLFRRVLYGVAHVIPKRWLYERLQREMTRYNGIETRARCCLLFPVYLTEYMDNTVLYPLGQAVFDGIEVAVPHDCDQYLTTHYGAYMTLPPEEQRVGHRPYRVVLNREEPSNA